MKVFWGGDDELTIHDVLDEINEDLVEPYAYSTINTVVVRLQRKGLLDRRRIGKAHAYWPVMDRDEFERSRARRSARSFLKQFGDLAVAEFADEVKADPDRLAKLRQVMSEDDEG